MIYLLTAYLIALMASLFVASWRVAIGAFAIESLVAGLLLLRQEGLADWPARIEAADLLLLRTFAIPLFLVAVLRRLRKEREFDTIPANFVIWTMALALLIAGYWFGHRLFPEDLPGAFQLGTAAAGLLTGLFILANQASPLGQIIGLLTMESGIALTEVLSGQREQWAIQLGLSVVFAWTAGLLWEFLRHFSELETQATESPGVPPTEEREVL